MVHAPLWLRGQQPQPLQTARVLQSNQRCALRPECSTAASVRGFRGCDMSAVEFGCHQMHSNLAAKLIDRVGCVQKIEYHTCASVGTLNPLCSREQKPEMKRVERHRSQSGTAPYGAYGAGRDLSGRDDLVSFELKGNQRSEMKHMERPRSESRRVPDRGDDIGTHLSRNSGAGVWGPKATSPISASDEDFGSSGSELERLASSFEF
jgi:hypothetical protein